MDRKMNLPPGSSFVTRIAGWMGRDDIEHAGVRGAPGMQSLRVSILRRKDNMHNMYFGSVFPRAAGDRVKEMIHVLQENDGSIWMGGKCDGCLGGTRNQ